MEGKNIIFFEVDASEEEFFRTKLESKGNLTFYPHRLTIDEVEEAAKADYLVSFIYSDFSHQILEKIPHLKGIATMSVGVDHIDIKETSRRNIIVSNVPAYGPNTVAEHTIALLLALSRNIVPAVERTRAGQYEYTGLTGWDVAGKTLGVVGTGKIGSVVARIANGLGMQLIGYDPHPNPELTQKYGLKYMPLPQLLSSVDVITLHMPLTDETKHMLGSEQFAQMRKGTVLLNTARGGLVDPQALVEALNNGTIAQAGLDVLEDEGLLKEERQFFSKYFDQSHYQTALADHALMRDERVLVTPHNAFNSREALKNILQTTVENLDGMMHNDPVNVVEKH